MGHCRPVEVPHYHQYILQKYLIRYLGAHAVFLVYDITNKESFESIQDFWLNEVESYADPGSVLVLVGINHLTQATNQI